MWKSWVWGSFFQTLPKSIHNRGPKKHTNFHRFLPAFSCLLQEPTSKKRAPTQCFVSFSHNSAYRFWHALSVQKTYQKPSQNEVRTLEKSMLKTCWFLTSIFKGLGLDFGGFWASKLEPSWVKLALKLRSERLLGAPGRLLGASWSPRASKMAPRELQGSSRSGFLVVFPYILM